MIMHRLLRIAIWELSFLVAGLLPCHSQPNDQGLLVEAGPVFKMDERAVPVDIIGYDNSGYYLLYADGRFGQGNRSLVKFLPNLVPTDEHVDLIPEEESMRNRTLGIIQIGATIYHVGVRSDPDLRQYYIQKVGLNPFSIGEKTLVAEVRSEERSVYKSLKTFLVSRDTSRIVLFYTVPNRNKDNERIRVLTFDKRFVQTDADEYEFPYTNKQFQVYSVQLMNDGRIFLLARLFHTTSVKADMMQNAYDYVIYELADGALSEVSRAVTGGMHMRQVDLVQLSDGQLVVTGFYSERNIYAIKGTFYQRVDPNSRKVLASKVQEFDSKFFTDLLVGMQWNSVSKRVAKGKFEDPYYVQHTVVESDHGSVVLEAEQIHLLTVYGVTTIYCQNIALVKLNGEGEIEWAKKIGKNNSKTNVDIYSHFLSVSRQPGELYLLYNDNEANLNHVNGPVAGAFQAGGAFVSAMINPDGAVHRSILARQTDLEGYIRPRLSRWLDGHTLLLFSQDMDNVRNQRFVKIHF